MKGTVLACLLLGAASVAACVAPPRQAPGQRFEPTEHGRVGVIFLTDPQAKHVHVGSTVFNNFEQSISQDWGLETLTMSKLSMLFEGHATAVRIDDPLPLDGGATVSTGWTAASMHAGLEPAFRQLASKYGVFAFIVIEPIADAVEPNSSVNADGYGVFTRCFLGKCRAEVLNNLVVRIFAADPPRYLHQERSLERNKRVALDLPDDMKVIKDSDLSAVKARFYELYGAVLQNAVIESGIAGVGA